MRIFGAILIALVWCLPAQAQMPPDLAEKVAALGRVIDPPRTNALYAPLHDGEPYPGATVVRDIRYGPDDLHALDIFKATQPGAGARPVLIHVHGGGFVRGDKHTAGTPFTDNIPLWAARNGMVGVNVNYRLAPKATWPAGTEDMAAILRWTKANIAAHGGDPAKVFLLGWSAGAHHVVSYLAFRQFHAADASPVAGAILLSGAPYDTTVFDMKPIEAYFGADASKYPSQSPTPGLLKSKIPLLVAFAGLDPPGIEQQSIDLVEALCKAQHCPRKVFLKTHSHMSIGAAIGTTDVELTNQILEFVKAGN